MPIWETWGGKANVVNSLGTHRKRGVRQDIQVERRSRLRLTQIPLFNHIFKGMENEYEGK